MTEAIPAYPLTWPPGRPRSKTRDSSQFRVTLARAIDDVYEEIEKLGGKELIVSSNLPLRRDGTPMAHRSVPVDTGVAVYFQYKGKPMCFACDRWQAIEDNMRAVAKTINALRGIARWGTGDMIQQAFTGFTALPTVESWWQVLGFKGPDLDVTAILTRHRELAMKHHPDRQGGDDELMARINRARDQGLEAIR